MARQRQSLLLAPAQVAGQLIFSTLETRLLKYLRQPFSVSPDASSQDARLHGDIEGNWLLIHNAVILKYERGVITPKKRRRAAAPYPVTSSPSSRMRP
ncbi:MAG: hypothetical protein RQM95_03160 [Syntrophaceticus schinkii]